MALPFVRCAVGKKNGTQMEYLTQRPIDIRTLWAPMYATRREVVDRVQNGVRYRSAVKGGHGGIIGLMALVAK